MKCRSITALFGAFVFCGSVCGQDVYEVGKEGDAPDPPSVQPLTEREICGDWKAVKVGNNESPVDDLYIYYGEKGFAFEGKYKDWQGQAMAGTESKVTVWRKPKAEEMSDKAPQWAREKVAAEGKLEWKLELKAESQKGEWVLEGKWYPGQFQWKENGESESSREATYLDPGKPVDVKFKKVPALVRTIVVNNQTGMNKGVPWHPYPFIFRPPSGIKATGSALVPPPARNGLGQEGDSRYLFVYGVNLPTKWGDQMDLHGPDNTVKYQVYKLATDNLNSDQKRLFKVGWDRAVQGLDRETEKTVRKCAAMLVRADLQRGVTGGVKKFTFNGKTDSWRLGFGNNGALLTFARDVTAEDNEDIDCAYLPEKIYIEIRTENVFPTQEIPLRARLGGKDVTWNGAETIVAAYVKDIPTPQSYEVPRAGEPAEVVPKVVRVYRTPTIQIGGEASSATKGYFLKANADDVLSVKADDPYLFAFRPAVASVKIWDAPDRDAASNLVGTWEETVQRAAILDGLGAKVKAGQNVAGSEAASFSNVVVTNIAFGKLRPAGEAAKQSLNDSFHSWTTLTPLWAPAMAWRFFFGNKGILTERVTVTVADHAALLLFKEAFIRKMGMGLAELEKRTKADSNEDAQRALWTGLREALKISGAKESPWESIRVSSPGGEVKMSWALDDGLSKQACKGMSDSAVEEWAWKAVQNGIGQYKENIKHAINKAKETPDNDVKKLIELIGYGYENLAPEVMQHMMWHGSPNLPPSSLWQPNLNARHALWNLHTGADAIRAQEDLSKLDTQMVMLAAGALAAPFMLTENLFVTICLYAMDVAMFEGQLITETVPELWEQYQREEIRFAIGASLVLGTDRLNEAELKKTEWYQTALNVLPSAMGVTMGGAGLHEMTRATAKTKAALVLEVFEKHGLQGAKRLTNSEKLGLIIHASEAEVVKEMGASKLLEASHERAAAAVEKIAGEAGAARSAKSQAQANKIKATGSATREELKPLHAGANPSGDHLHRFDVEPVELSAGEAAETRPATQQYPGTEFPPEEPTGVTKPGTQQYPPTNFPPEKPTEVKKPGTQQYPPTDFPPEKPTDVKKPGTQQYPPTDFPPEKPTDVKKPGTQQYPPTDFPPEKPTNVQKPVGSKAPEVQPKPVEKTPQVIRTADEFAELLAPPPPRTQGQPAVPRPTHEGTEIRVRINNEIVDLTLGKKLGEGGFAGVWEIAAGPPKYKGKAVKLTYLDRGESFRMRPEEFESASRTEAVKQSHVGYKEDVEKSVTLLDGNNKTQTRFEYAAIHGTGADENVAVVIQDYIKPVMHPNLAREGDCLILSEANFLKWADKHGLADAVVELFWQLKEAGLVWEDCKLGNMYFRKKNSQWVAGVIDVDRIFVHADRVGRRGIFLDFVEAANVFYKGKYYKGRADVGSLDNSTRLMFADENHAAADFIMRQNGAVQGPYFKDAEEFMMIMFEYHGWITYDKASGKFVKRLIDPAVIQKQILPGQTEPAFPRLSDPARFKPRNLDAPYIPPPKIGMLRVLPALKLNAPAAAHGTDLTSCVFALQAA